MTTNQITAAVRRKVLEETTDVVSDETILLYANEAFMDVYKQGRSARDILNDTVTFTSGVGTLPSDFGVLYGDPMDADGNFYPQVPLQDFLRGTLEKMVTIEGGELKVVPDTTASVTIRYWDKPAALTGGSTPQIHEYFHEPIIYGTLWRVYEDLQDEELATLYEGKFSEDLKRRIDVQSEYEESNQTGSAMFSHQNLI